MVTAQCMTDSQQCQVVLSPNGSFSWLQSAILFTSLAVILSVIGVGFAWYGLWMVLPFAGLELLVLGMCLIMVSRAGARRQVITIDKAQVCVEIGTCVHRLINRSGPNDKFVYPRCWVKLNCIKPEHDWYPSRLMIGASGRNVEIGEFLTEEERQILAKRLGQWL